MINKILQHFLQLGTRCMLRIHGKELEGYFIQKEKKIEFVDSNNNEIPLSDEMVSDIDAILMLSPVEKTVVQKPVVVHANAEIISCNQYKGTVSYKGDSNTPIHLNFDIESILDEELYHLAKDENPKSLIGKKVFCGPGEFKKDKVFSTNFLLKENTLDNILDLVLNFAKEGYLEDAYHISKALKLQYGNNVDVCIYHKKLEQAYEEYLQKTSVNLYSAIPVQHVSKVLRAKGRITEYNGKAGKIVDIDSHKELLFLKDNLLISKEYEDDYIGLPVTYVVIEKYANKYEARSVIEPSEVFKALDLAEDLEHADLTAWGIAQIILEEYPDDFDAQEFVREKESIYYVKANKWKLVNLPKYHGKEEERILQIPVYPDEINLPSHSINMENEIEVVKSIEKISLIHTSVSEQPVIDDVPTESSAHVNISEQHDNGRTETTEQVLVTGQNTIPKKHSTFTGKTIGTDFENLADAELDVESNDIESEDINKLKYTHIIRERKGHICYIDGMTGDPEDDITFTLNDIIDVDLLEQARNELRKDRFLKGEKIICQIDNKRAYAVFKPMGVSNAIEMAKKTGIESYQHLDEGDIETSNILKRKAIGVLESILDEFPNCREAIDIRFKLINNIRDLNASLYDELIDTEISSNIEIPLSEGSNRNGIIKTISQKDEDGLYIPGCVYDDLSHRILSYISSSILDLDFQEEVNTPVMYSIKDLNGKPVAWCIHKPKTVEELITFADELEHKRKMPIEAWGIINQALSLAPNNEELKIYLEHLESSNEVREGKPKLLQLSSQEDSGNDFQLAGKQAFREKEYQTCISLLEKAISVYNDTLDASYDSDMETNSMHFNATARKEECICLIESCYRKWYSNCEDERESIKSAYKEFGNIYLPNLRRNFPANLRSIENYYLFFHDRNKYLQVLEELVNVYSRSRTIKARRNLTDILTKIAEFHLLDNKKESNSLAKRFAQRAIKNDRENNSVQARVIIAVTNYREGRKGNCIDYIDDTKFSMENLLKIKSCVDIPIYEQEYGQYAKEEASYYYNLLNFKNAKKQSDIIRFLGKCLSAYEKRSTGIDAENDDNTIIEKRNYDFAVARRLLECMKYKPNWQRWNNLMEVCLVNANAGRIVINMMYDISPSFCTNLLSRFGANVNHDAKKSQIFRTFEKIRHNLADKYNRWIGYSQALALELKTSGKKLESFRRNFQHFIVSDEKWMLDSDVFLVNMIHRRILEYLDTYINSSSSRVAYQAYEEIHDYIHSVELEISLKPTLLSTNAIKPLFDVLLEALYLHHSTQQMSSPQPELRILTASALDDDKCVNFQICITNKEPWSAPIQQQQLTIVWSNCNEVIIKRTENISEIYGSESKVLLVRTKVEHPEHLKKLIKCKIEYRYQFNTNGNQSNNSLEIEESVEIPEFTPLVSPYAASGSKCQNTEMFYGRKEFIKKICSYLNVDIYGQYLIFGQKRSGKSSVLFHLKKEIERENDMKDIPSVICSETSYLDISSTDLAYYRILSSLKEELEKFQNLAKRRYREKFMECKKAGIDTSTLSMDIVPQFILPEQHHYFEIPESPENKFEIYIKKFNKLLKETPGWENIKIIVMIDEFTSVHKAIKDGVVSNTFMQTWKRIQEQESTRFASILIGQDVTNSLQRDYANIYSIIHDYRLTYLDSKDALKLITEPLKKIGVKYAQKSEKRVLYYTAGNPYYIWLFCHQLIEQLNATYCNVITEKTVDDVAEYLSYNMSDKYFDNLVLAGEDEKVSEFSKKQNEAILQRIALESEKLGSCSKAALSLDYSQEKENSIDGILKNLEDREVIKRDGNQYSIIVKLYSKWLCEQYRKIF